MGDPGIEKRTTCGQRCVSLWNTFNRTKTINKDKIDHTELKRCLNLFDLTTLGIGCTLGNGVYVITGIVAHSKAGPAVLLSYMIAGFASLLAGLCYCEFASRIPRAGSAYVYIYLSIGELWAFVVGWNLILEDVIGAAAAGKAVSQYFDSMLNNTISNGEMKYFGTFHSEALGRYPDLLACGVLLFIILCLSIGVKISALVINLFTMIGFIVAVVVAVAGCFFIDINNWKSDGGFFPFGFHGALAGAATCFYAFIGFDVVATSSEEAKHPTRDIPRAIVLTLIISCISYMSLSAVLTLMVPWQEIPIDATLARIFQWKGLTGMTYVVAIGGIAGLMACVIGTAFPLPRIIYAIAQDGLMFPFLGRINGWTKTPFIATWCSGVLVACFALLLDLESLIEMQSIGTLMAYTLVSASVLVVRYQEKSVGIVAEDLESTSRTDYTEEDILFQRTDQSQTSYLTGDLTPKQKNKFTRCVERIKHVLPAIHPCNPSRRPTTKTTRIATMSMVVVAVAGCAAAILLYQGSWIFSSLWGLLLFLCSLFVVAMATVVMAMQPQNSSHPAFVVPAVPVVPVMSVVMNILLMVMLSYKTWIRFAVWLTLGMIIYLGYGVRHSKENVENQSDDSGNS